MQLTLSLSLFPSPSFCFCYSQDIKETFNRCVATLFLCDPVASGSPSLPLLDIPLLSFLPQDPSFCLLDPPFLPLSFCSSLWEYHGPTPCPVPFLQV